MRTFAAKQNQPQKLADSSIAKSQAQRMRQTTDEQLVDEQLEAGLANPAAPRFGHDFSRVLLHSPAAGVIQTKSTISQPGDSYEQEADRLSERVLRMPELPLERACACDGNCSKCRTQPPAHPHEHLQTKQVSSSGSQQVAAPSIVQEVLRSSGEPIDRATRAFMEVRFGHDFSRVRVHTGVRASESAQAVNALAYTVGHNVVFRAGHYSPGTERGRRLLAHELAHVLQQGAVSTAQSAASGVTQTQTMQHIQRQTPPSPLRPDGAAQRPPTHQDMLSQLRQSIAQAEEALRRPELMGSTRERIEEVLRWAREAEAEIRQRTASNATNASSSVAIGATVIPAVRTAAPTVVRGIAVSTTALASGLLLLLASMLTSGASEEDLAAQAYAGAESANYMLRSLLQSLPQGTTIMPLRNVPPIPPLTIPVTPPVPAQPVNPPAVPARPAPPIVTTVPPLAHRPVTRVSPRTRRRTTRRRRCDCWCFENLTGDGIELPYKYPQRCAMVGIPPLTTPESLQQPEVCSHWCFNVPPDDMRTYLQSYGYGAQRFMTPPFRYFSCGRLGSERTPRTRWRRFVTVGSPQRP
jgi:Domain of unknown function (DUF4157)